MHASKVVINDELLKPGKLNRKQKRRLRERAIIEYIESRPLGDKITSEDFARAARFNTAGEGWAFAKDMVKRKLIYQDDIPGERGYSYRVASNKTTRTTTAQHLGTRDKELLERAKQFVWEENSDSLRDFIKWLNK